MPLIVRTSRQTPWTHEVSVSNLDQFGRRFGNKTVHVQLAPPLQTRLISVPLSRILLALPHEDMLSQQVTLVRACRLPPARQPVTLALDTASSTTLILTHPGALSETSERTMARDAAARQTGLHCVRLDHGRPQRFQERHHLSCSRPIWKPQQPALPTILTKEPPLASMRSRRRRSPRFREC